MTWDGVKRRSTDKPPVNEFQPQSAFEGYMKASLENIESRLNRLPCDDTFQRLSKVENKLSNIEGKATIIGAISGLLAALFKEHLFKR